MPITNGYPLIEALHLHTPVVVAVVVVVVIVIVVVVVVCALQHSPVQAVQLSASRKLESG